MSHCHALHYQISPRLCQLLSGSRHSLPAAPSPELVYWGAAQAGTLEEPQTLRQISEGTLEQSIRAQCCYQIRPLWPPQLVHKAAGAEPCSPREHASPSAPLLLTMRGLGRLTGRSSITGPGLRQAVSLGCAGTTCVCCQIVVQPCWLLAPRDSCDSPAGNCILCGNRQQGLLSFTHQWPLDLGV